MLDNAASSIQEPKPACPFDAAAALERLDGDEELFRALVNVFQQDSVELFEQLLSRLAAGQVRDVERAAHSLRGLAANFDAKEAVEAAFLIEETARCGSLVGIEPRIQELGTRLAELRGALARWEG
jgi:two-component system, sensor histidine kinase and response regulator